MNPSISNSNDVDMRIGDDTNPFSALTFPVPISLDNTPSVLPVAVGGPISNGKFNFDSAFEFFSKEKENIEILCGDAVPAFNQSTSLSETQTSNVHTQIFSKNKETSEMLAASINQKELIKVGKRSEIEEISVPGNVDRDSLRSKRVRLDLTRWLDLRK